MPSSPQPSRYLSLYRVHRPQKFTDVIGQDHVVSVLSRAIEEHRIGHAYLFCGSRGIGKTSIARIFARDMGCFPEDIYEIDGASNRKIEDIRALREAVHTMPFRSPYKVYIIDEVHMLTKEAFNALLKTLEEPPAHVIFMLATTEKEKVPDTIISRCQLFELKTPHIEDIKKLILHIASLENINIDSDAAELIALLGDGSFRDTLGILEKVQMLSPDTTLSSAEVERVTGAPSVSILSDFFDALRKKDLATSISIARRIGEGSGNEKIFIERLIHITRMILHLRFGVEKKEQLQKRVSAGEWDIIVASANKESLHLNSHFLKKLLELGPEIARASIPSLPIELALIELLGENAQKHEEKPLAEK